MKNTKLAKEMLPIAVLLIFIAVVLVLCAVSAGSKKKQEVSVESTETEKTWVQEDVEEESVSVAIAEVQKTIELEQAMDTKAEQVEQTALDALETAEAEPEKEPVAEEAVIRAGTVSSNSTAVISVKKTNVEMLAEMMDYWSKGNMAAVEDLSGLAHYRAMSATLNDPSCFYYYGDRNTDGKPEGKGIAVYGSDQYYYGDWKNGMREGDGMWIRMYYENGFTIPGVNTVYGAVGDVPMSRAVGFSVKPDPVLISHRYRGLWAQDLPNGEGHEQYILDITKADGEAYYLQNAMGNFENGLYHGAMYLITVDEEGNIQEWNGKATQGVFEGFDNRDDMGRIPIWQDKQNADSHMWIDPLNNIDLGLTELRAQIRERAADPNAN